MRQLFTSLLRHEGALPPPDPTTTVRYPKYYVAHWTAEVGKRLRGAADGVPPAVFTARKHRISPRPMVPLVYSPYIESMTLDRKTP
jgi:hypothetical protein